ncbi:MAG: hypothetical protein ACREGR_00310, partial [Minisyncoccia bacterium]
MPTKTRKRSKVRRARYAARTTTSLATYKALLALELADAEREQDARLIAQDAAYCDNYDWSQDRDEKHEYVPDQGYEERMKSLALLEQATLNSLPAELQLPVDHLKPSDVQQSKTCLSDDGKQVVAIYDGSLLDSLGFDAWFKALDPIYKGGDSGCVGRMSAEYLW